jgi:hypothetical protein
MPGHVKMHLRSRIDLHQRPVKQFGTRFGLPAAVAAQTPVPYLVQNEAGSPYHSRSTLPQAVPVFPGDQWWTSFGVRHRLESSIITYT